MWTGLFFSLAACMIWGLIFPIPMLLEGFNAVEVTLGRFLFLGILSFFLLIFKWKFLTKILNWHIIKYVLYLGFLNIFYFVSVVSSLRYCHPAIVALILGTSPIALGLFGNVRNKEAELKKLLILFIITGLGLLLINLPALEEVRLAGSLFIYMFGLLAGCSALLIWCLFAITNARFLRTESQISASNWASLIGIGTLTWVILITLGASFFVDGSKYFSLNKASIQFYCGCAVLGFLCSWLGSYLWNKASTLLPISMAGQMLIFETLFGIVFIYLIKQQMPSNIEIIGMITMLIGTWFALLVFRKAITE